MVSPDSPSPKWSRRSPEAVAKSSTGWRFILIAVCAFALGFATYRVFLQPPAPAPPPPAEAVVDSERMISLFYPLADGSGLASTILKRPACREETACLEDLLRALGENPGAGSFPLLTLPNGRHVAVAVFVATSSKPLDAREAAIAQIAKAAYDYWINK